MQYVNLLIEYELTILIQEHLDDEVNMLNDDRWSERIQINMHEVREQCD